VELGVEHPEGLGVAPGELVHAVFQVTVAVPKGSKGGLLVFAVPRKSSSLTSHHAVTGFVWPSSEECSPKTKSPDTPVPSTDSTCFVSGLPEWLWNFSFEAGPGGVHWKVDSEPSWLPLSGAFIVLVSGEVANSRL
jgi:hypothetical protein